MVTGLYKRPIDTILDNLPLIDYNEPFDVFCRAKIATGYLTSEEVEILKDLLAQWESNKERGK